MHHADILLVRHRSVGVSSSTCLSKHLHRFVNADCLTSRRVEIISFETGQFAEQLKQSRLALVCLSMLQGAQLKQPFSQAQQTNIVEPGNFNLHSTQNNKLLQRSQ